MRQLVRSMVIGSLLLGGGCVAGDALAAADPVESPVPEAQPQDGRLVVTDDPSIVPGRRLHVDTWSRDAAQDSVAVQFWLASPGCTGVHADVRETTDSVAVALSEGGHPSEVGRMCSMIVVPATLAITLDAPLGDRTVVSSDSQ